MAMRSSSLQPIHSTLIDRPGAAELIVPYVEHVRKVGNSLRTAVAKNGYKESRHLLPESQRHRRRLRLRDADRSRPGRPDRPRRIAEQCPGRLAAELDALVSIAQRLSTDSPAQK